jgi:hypothetical protein
LDATTVRAIAREAYIYGYPMVDSYRIQYEYFEDRSDSDFQAPWNHLLNVSRVYTVNDTTIGTPNSDTPYSMVGMDLRREPMVLSVPPIEETRYFSVQLVDAYTYNFGYMGSRTRGNGGGSFLVAGPRWSGETPSGVDKVFRSETEFALAVFRTQLFGPDDLENVKRAQAGYRAQPLSRFAGAPAPAAERPVDLIKPLGRAAQRTSPEFFNILSFVLRFCPTHPSERELMTRFAEIGVGAGRHIDMGSVSSDIKTALEQGMADAWDTFAEFKKQRLDTKEVAAGDLYGTRDSLKGDYLYRMAAAVLAIYGHSKQEVMYWFYTMDADGRPLSGADRYVMRFSPSRLPPVNAFWSLTMYRLPESLLVANPLDRYLLNSLMVPRFRRDDDGGLSFLVQHDAPRRDEMANWLPAPEGPFMMALRLYWPREEALRGNWTEPAVRLVS